MGRDSELSVKSLYNIGEGDITPKGGILYVSIRFK